LWDLKRREEGEEGELVAAETDQEN